MPKTTFATQHPYGPSFGRLIDRLAGLPGIGRKSAERMAYHLLNCDPAETRELAESLRSIREVVHPCGQCFNLTEGDLCEICRDPRRDRQSVCVVEQPKDLIALEAAGVFAGLYHVLGGRISPLNGVGPDDLNIDALVQRVREQHVQEIVMATNPNLEGDGTALYISNLLAREPVRISRLARGVATGSVLEFANREMLADALRGRQTF
ncbi:MAG: recombination mediator RecR [Planctomycetaceae bacterium]